MTIASALIRAVLPIALLMAGATQANAQPRVVASIMPVHSLVAGVMDGVATPGLLVQGAASAHTYSLRPSDAKRLNEGKVIFWIGEIYEGFLEKPLEALANKATVVELMEADGVTLLPARTGGTWEAHEHGKATHAHAHDANAAEMDGHLFLDIDNAKAIVRAALAALVAADGANKDRYTANAAKVTARLDALDAELRTALAPVKDRPFVVFHDAYQYVELRYGLTGAGAITVSPERRPGAKRLSDLRKKIATLKAVCVFSEPQFEPTLVRTVTEGTTAKTGTLDPLGAGLTPGPDAYFDMMRRLAKSLSDCLRD
jgi:zinc transport system substrate-binding protein